jgi:hypothetical protein
MDHSEGDKRVRIVHDLVPRDWVRGPLSLAHELREFLKSVVDEGTNIDSGGGDGVADLWPTIGGREYHIRVVINGAPEWVGHYTGSPWR